MVTMPVDKGFVVTSGFGSRWGTTHWGTDYGRNGGSGGFPVYAVKDGTVTRSGPASGFGRWITVDHPASNGGGLTVYGHIIPELGVGTRVREGQRIGRIDPNSATNGGVAPHLHLEWHRYVWSQPGPDRLNPQTMLAGARWPGESAPAPTPPKGGPVQPTTTYTQLTDVDRGPRDPKTVPLIAIHTYECPREGGERALRNRASYQQTSRTGSYNVLVAADGKSLRANDDNYTPAASLVTGDRNGFHLSFLAYASDSRATWLKYDAQLREAARICGEWVKLYGHAVRRLSVEEVRSKKVKGFCSHGDISAAYRESDHTDPGPNFPWDVFLRYVGEHVNGTSQRKDILDMDEATLKRIIFECLEVFVGPIGSDVKDVRQQLTGGRDKGEYPGFGQIDNRTFVDALAKIGVKLDIEGFEDIHGGSLKEKQEKEPNR